MSPTDLIELVDATPATVPARDAFVSMVERLATNNAVDVLKLEKLIELQERIVERNAKAAFWAAFPAMQKALPRIDEHGKIKVGDQVRGVYAKEEDIQAAILPVLAQHGFSLSFRTEYPSDGLMDIVGVLAHREGHTETDRFRCKADNSGQKNDVQALGSSRAYGRRYTTISLLNVITGGQDDDGRAAGNATTPDAPAGYEDWWDDLTAVSDEGSEKLRAAWDRSKPTFRAYLTKHNATGWAALKIKAGAVK